jgi:hypothetical protein
MPADPFHSAQPRRAASRMLRVSLITFPLGGTLAHGAADPYSSK